MHMTLTITQCNGMLFYYLTVNCYFVYDVIVHECLSRRYLKAFLWFLCAIALYQILQDTHSLDLSTYKNKIGQIQASLYIICQIRLYYNLPV